MLLVNMKKVFEEKNKLTSELLNVALNDASKMEAIKAQIQAIEGFYNSIAKHQVEVE